MKVENNIIQTTPEQLTETQAEEIKDVFLGFDIDQIEEKI